MKPRPFFLMLFAFFLGAGFVVGQGASEFKGHGSLVFNVAFSPDGTTLATASFDGTVKLWDFATGKEKGILKGHTGPVYAVIFSKEGAIATAGNDLFIKLWDKDGKFVKEMKGHTGIIDTLAFSPDGKTIASGSADKAVKLWSAVDAKEVKSLGSHKDTVYSVAFSPKGDKLASAGNDGFIKIWDVAGQKEEKQFEIPVYKPVFVEPKKADPKDEKKEEKKKEEKKDEKKKEAKKEEPREIRDGVTGVAFSSDGGFVYTVGFDKLLRVWNVADGKETAKFGPAPDDLFGIAVSRDGKLVATAGYGGSLKVYEMPAGKEIFAHKLKNLVTYCVQFTPDGKALVTGHEKDGSAKVTPIVAGK